MEIELDEVWRDSCTTSMGTHYMVIHDNDKVYSISYYNLKEASKKQSMDYREWFKQIQFLKDKVILPDGISISKSYWVTSKGFDFDKFNDFLLTTYKDIYGK